MKFKDVAQAHDVENRLTKELVYCEKELVYIMAIHDALKKDPNSDRKKLAEYTIALTEIKKKRQDLSMEIKSAIEFRKSQRR